MQYKAADICVKEMDHIQSMPNKFQSKNMSHLAESLVFESRPLQTSAAVGQLVLKRVHLKEKERNRRRKEDE